jgi:hypothetical protein
MSYLIKYGDNNLFGMKQPVKSAIICEQRKLSAFERTLVHSSVILGYKKKLYY